MYWIYIRFSRRDSKTIIDWVGMAIYYLLESYRILANKSDSGRCSGKIRTIKSPS
ncbi:MAG: hypothetical protein [Caudoviricetes sp.]|nr:MAG: hypothetical protein [Caudoviricetes sp.]